jgi:uncharacterized protein YecT (DUF1311 family)
MKIVTGLTVCMLLVVYSQYSDARCSTDFDRSFDDECLRATVQESDANVERLYQRLLDESDETRRQLLVRSQESWTAYRARQCSVEFDLTRAMHQEYSSSGTAAPNYELRCRRRLDQDRLLALRFIAKQSGINE